MRLLTDSEDDSEESNERQNIEIAIDGTVWKKIETSSTSSSRQLWRLFAFKCKGVKRYLLVEIVSSTLFHSFSSNHNENRRRDVLFLISPNKRNLSLTSDLLTVIYFFIIFTSHSEATRRLFWDGPPTFEPWADDEGHPPSPNFCATPAGGHLTPADLMGTRPVYIFDGIRFQTWKSLIPKRRPYHQASVSRTDFED
ncbi:hypothetical protein AVEN_1940-1 [Araneus ventricosus]|uniref:Uncharacterized protein n=1 Tax=Araneus ventricosus TaxID=182803 RepID=A0A4Y2GEW5_ARAVE|nr:hypothetical protein AVEN_1940-1 [Araneus ventricosus]